MADAREPCTANVSVDHALLLLNELSGMTAAGIPWSDGLGGVGRDAPPHVARLANHLQQELAQGRHAPAILTELGRSLGAPMQHLLEIAMSSPDPAKALDGLIAITSRVHLRRRSTRLAMYYPTMALLVSVLILAAAWWAATNPDLISSRLYLRSEPTPWLIPIQWWFVPMCVGFALATITVIASFAIRGFRPDHWSRLAWFADLLALQIEAAVPLPLAVERGAVVALTGTPQNAAVQWAKSLQRGEVPGNNNRLPGLLGWLIATPLQPIDELITALRRVTGLYEERAESLQRLWISVLPNLVLICTVGSMAISYVLLVIVPIYRSLY